MKKSIKINALLNAIRQCCTICFPLITVPYISRIIGNENYGKINYSSSIVSYFILLAGLGVNAYGIREGAKVRNDKEKINKFASEIFTINLITTLLSYCILVILLLFWDKTKGYELLIVIQAVPIFFTCIGVDWLNNVFEDFFYTTVRYIIIQILSFVLMFAMVRKADDYLIYAGILACSNILGNIVNLFYMQRRHITIKIVRKPNIKKHITPLLLLFCNNITTTIYVNSDITLLTIMKGDTVTGIYSIAVKIYTIVKQFINAVIGVALPRLSLYIGEEQVDKYNEYLSKIMHAILIIILPATTGIFALSEEIILLISGEEYVLGSVALKILAIALGFSVFSFFYVYAILIPYGLEKKCLISSIVSAVLNVALNFIIIPRYGMEGAAFTTLLSEVLVVLMSMHFAKGKYRIMLSKRKLVPSIVSCISILAICNIVKSIFKNSIVIFVLAFVLSVIGYLVIMIWLKDEIVKETIDSVLKKTGLCKQKENNR